MSFFSKNIAGTGRLIRGSAALLLTIACGVAMGKGAPWWLQAVLGISAAFVWYESVRGWCVLRACGIKTRW